MRNVFFENVPNVGNLFINKVLMEYDLEPIIFVCKDSFNNFFLCICDDFINLTRSWIAIKISVEDLVDIINDKVTLLSVFKKSENETIVIDYCPDTNSFDYRIMKFADIDENELPCEDQYLDEKDTFEGYIDYLKSYIVSYELQYDSDYIDTIYIDINKNQPEENIFIEKDYDFIRHSETSEKSNEVNIKLNSKFLFAA